MTEETNYTALNSPFGAAQARPHPPQNFVVFSKDNFEQLGGFDPMMKNIASRLAIDGQLPTCEVQVQDLNYCPSGKRPSSSFVLKNINAIFKPGTMTLILGPPGCGKSSLMKILGGMIKSKQREVINGNITYNGRSQKESNLPKLTAYVPQMDLHIPTLTVKETVDFAHDCNMKLSDTDPLAEFEKNRVDLLLHLFGLFGVKDTIVGNEMLRGVSGGQKRRVTLAEMVVGEAIVILSDEFSTGLDTTTTVEITQMARTVTTILQKTFICSMLQPPPEAYQMFDQIIVLDGGELIYAGPRPMLRDYFTSIGYTCPPRKDIADFCQEVTTDIGNLYFDGGVPLSDASQFAEKFQESSISKATQHTLAYEPFDPESFSIPARLQETLDRSFALRFCESLKLVFKRQIKIVLRDKEFNKVRVGQSFGMGLLVGSLFYNLSNDPSQLPIKMGVFFLSLLFLSLSTISNIQYTIEIRNTFYKQHYFHFYLPLVYAVSESMMEVMWSVVQALLFTTPVYWLTGLSDANSGESFFIFVLINILNSLVFAQWFKFCASVSPDDVSAQILAGFSIFMTQIFSGFVLPEGQLPDGWVWFFWINPSSWAFRSICQNEFLSDTSAYSMVDPNGQTRGEKLLTSYGISTNDVYLWSGVGMLVVFYLLFLAMTAAAYQFIRFDTIKSKKQPQGYRNSTDFTTNSSQVTIDISASKSENFVPVTLSFRDLWYTVQVVDGETKKKKDLDLLKGIHGMFKPGSLTALMGSSGAGKTTLLDVLASRKTTGTIKGNIYVNGHIKDENSFNRITAYVEQTDVHQLNATVEESLVFNAFLRLPAKMDELSRRKIVEDTIQTMQLEKHRNSEVSTLTREQLKRLTIATQLVANPSVLFLDEPTSGLDARAAYVVVSTLQRIKKTGRTIVCTIHQPNAMLFEMFDQLLLLRTGGKMVYFGPLGENSSSLLQYFEQVDTKKNVEPIEPTANPATYMLDVINNNKNKDPEQVVDFAEAYDASAIAQSNLAALDQVVQGEQIIFTDKYNASAATRFIFNFSRFLYKFLRSRQYWLGKLVVSVLVACVFGSMFGSSELNTTAQVLSQMTILYLALIYMGVINIVIGLPVIYLERQVYYREKASRMYSSANFVITLALNELPYLFLNSVLFVNIFYWWVIGTSGTTSAFLWFWLMYLMYSGLMVFLAHFFVFLFPDVQTGTVVMGIFTSLVVNFSGFIIPKSEMPTGWQFMYWLSPLHYAYEVIITTQYFDNSDVIQSSIDNTTTTVAAYVDSYFGGSFDTDHRTVDIIAVCIWIGLVGLGAYLAIRYISHLKR